MLGLLFNIRDLGRLEQIASVWIRYGFGDAVRRLGMAGALERVGKALNWSDAQGLAHLDPPERVRRALQDLGPAFVKLGQLLATRVDLFPPEWIEQFEQLQDRAPASPPEAVRAQLLEDLGAPPEEVFARFEVPPIAAGSVAQVHRAALADGTEVAVKVRRPGIRPVVEADLRLLARVAELLEEHFPDLTRFRPREVAKQFTLTLRSELDLAAECRSAERIAASLAEFADIVVPKVYWEWTGERMNVQAFVEGIPCRDLDALRVAGLDRRLLARRGANAVLKTMISDGFFHADPHPGNVFYLPDNRIALLDFGMVGRLSERRRAELLEMLGGIVDQSASRVLDVMLDWAGAARVDRERLLLDLDGFLDRYHGLPLRQLHLGAMLTDLMALMREHHLALPPDLALVVKTIVTLEATGRELDPEFDMIGEAKPFVRAAMLERNSAHALVRRGSRALSTLLSLAGDLPDDLRTLRRALLNGSLQMNIDLSRLQQFGAQMNSAANRLAVGIVTAALLIGSAIVSTVPGGQALLGLPLLGLLGFLGAIACGGWLLLSIWRSSRR